MSERGDKVVDLEIARAVIKAASSSRPVKGQYDYYKDGILYCGKCKTAKEAVITIGGESVTVRCICQCEKAERERAERRRQYEEEMRRIRDLKTGSLIDTKLRNATLSTFVANRENAKLYTIIRNYVDNFNEFYTDNIGLLFWGSVGSGKSYAAACIANELLDRRKSVIMTSFVKILQAIQFNSELEAQLLSKMCSASLLIIDDLGAERRTEYALEKVYNVVDSRYRAGRPLIVTTNLELESMQKEQDDKYQKIYDRIFEMCHPVKVDCPSWRIEKAKERFNKTKKLLET